MGKSVSVVMAMDEQMQAFIADPRTMHHSPILIPLAQEKCYLADHWDILHYLLTRGPFRLVRHPADFGELLMIYACWLAAPVLATAWPLIAIIPLVALRIFAEERVMVASSAYADYAGKVRWRLIPLLW